jgi:hypothetical protein
MSANRVLHDALCAALRGHAPLAAAVTGVFDSPPRRAAVPYAVVDEPLLADWSTKDMAGREGRIAVLLHDEGEAPARLRDLIGAAEAGIEAMPRAIGAGWRLASLVLLRSRIARDRDGRWAAMSEWRVRMLRES